MIGNFFVPNTGNNKKNVHHGTVISVGPGITKKGRKIPMNVTKNDKVIFSAWSGTNVSEYKRFNFCDEEFVIMREKDILGVIV